MLLPKTEQIPTDFFRKGETVRAVVAKVENKNKIIAFKGDDLFIFINFII